MRAFWAARRSRQTRDDLAQEINFHLQEATEAYVKEGLSPAEARRRALVELGGREQVTQSLRDIHSSAFVESLRFYWKAAVRFLLQAPAFSVAAIVTLAVGIGANSAVFSAVDAVMLRPLPFPGGDELMLVTQRNQRNPDANRSVAPARLEDWNRLAAGSFAGITGYYKDDFTETSGSLPERLTGEMVAPRFLQVLGVAPMLGRDFLPIEEHWGGPSAALISYHLWRTHFGADPNVLGKSLQVGRVPLPIVGVMPATFAFPGPEVDLWTPSTPDAPFAGSRDSTWFTVIGRLRANISVPAAQADLALVQRQLGRQFPRPDADLAAEMMPLKETIVGSARASLWLLYGSVSLLLLIACSNLAALLLARTADREHEISVRFSLGASRRALVLQLLAEIAGLTLLGSLLGLAVAGLLLRGIHLAAGSLPRVGEITLNWRVLLYSVGCAATTTLFCGLYPAWRGTRRELARCLAATGRTQAGTRSGNQWLLVGVQVTLSVVLLTGAGLLLRSLQKLGHVDAGFDAHHVLTFQVSGSWGETGDRGRLTQRIDRTLDALRNLPGVEAAATSAMLPGVPGTYQQEFKIDGHMEAGRPTLADSRFVSVGYFETVRIPLLAGNVCKDGPGEDGLLVNRAFVDRYFGGKPAMGHQVSTAAGQFQESGQIRGLVGNAREGGLNTAPVPTVYFCTSAPTASPNYLIRTRGDAMGMGDAVRRKLHEIEPSRSVFAIMPLQQHLKNAFFEDRLQTILLIAFATASIVLACIGLYGTLSYLGRVRSREIALRLALGATRSGVSLDFLLQGLRVTVLGCVAGAFLSALGSRFLSRMLYGVSALDAGTYFGVLLFVLLAAIIACALPARRAAQVEPVSALRSI